MENMNNANENMNTEVVTGGWDPRTAFRSVLFNKLAEVGIEFTEQEKEKIADYLISQKVIKLDSIKNLNQFSHTESIQPKYSLLINEFIIYVTESTSTVKRFAQQYNDYLDEEGLDSYDYSYEQYIADREIEDSEIQEVKTHVSSTKLGDVVKNLVATKNRAKKDLDFSTNQLDTLKEAVNDPFLAKLMI